MWLRKFFLVFLAGVLFLISPSLPVSYATKLAFRKAFPPVLMYHDIKPVPINGFDVSVGDFKKQLDFLQQKGYTTLSAEQITECVKKRQAFPEKSILITFDDGYQGIYTYAAPELKRRNMKAVFFMIPGDFDKALKDYPYVTTKQVLEMAQDPNFSICSHTMTHPSLITCSTSAIKEELIKSKQILEKLTGRPCDLLAYPCGYYNNDVITAVNKAGYTAAFAVSDRGMVGKAARFSIPRIYMGTIMGKNNMKLFKYSVEHYKEMPKEAFVERYKFFKK